MSIRDLKIHELLFYVFLFLIPIQLRVIYSPDSAYIDWYFNYHLAFFVYLSDLVLAACLTAWIIFERPKIQFNTLFWLILGFFGIIILSWLHVEHTNLAFYGTVKWLELVVLVFYMKQTLVSPRQFKWSAYTIYVTAVLQAFLGLVQFHMQHMVGLRWLGEYIPELGISGVATVAYGTEKIIRAYGTMPHPNVLGGFLVVGLILGLYLGSKGQGPRGRIIVSGGTLLITLGIFVSFSRVAWLAAVLTYLFYFAYYFRYNRLKIVVPGVIFLVSCATIYLWHGDLVFNRVQNSDPVSISDRGVFNNMGLELVSRQTWLGTGIGNYVPALRQQYPDLEAWQYQPAHNIFIVIAAQTGILGLLMFVVLLFWIFYRASVSRGTIKYVLVFAGLIVVAMGQLDHYFVTIQQGQLIFFTLLGFLAAWPNINEELN